jgi:hypothetical protein
MIHRWTRSSKKFIALENAVEHAYRGYSPPGSVRQKRHELLGRN